MTSRLQFLIFLFSVVSVLAVGSGPWANAQNDGPNDLGRALANDFTDWTKAQAITPRIVDGKVVCDEPRAQMLLQYVIDDYKKRDLSGVSAATYSVASGIGNITVANGEVKAFKMAGKPPATYFVSVGGDIGTAESAVFLAAFVKANGTHDLEILLRWDDQKKVWALAKSSGPGAEPLEPEQIK
jgi:hypothetical protein